MSHYAQNVTLSSMSHLVYITLLGETEGVTLSRLGCIPMQRPAGQVPVIVAKHWLWARV
jgi:hypothetical protein